MPRDSEDKQAARSLERGVVAAGIKDPAEKRKFIAAQGEGKMSDAELDAQTYRVRNENEAAKVLAPTMHNGGVVKKDGLHNLQKGEVVVPKDKAGSFSGSIFGNEPILKAREAEGNASTMKSALDKVIAAPAPPKMHDGGEVKKDGLHDLQKGEVVIPKDKVMMDKSGIIDGLMEDAKEKAEPKDAKKGEKKSEKKSSAHSHRPHHTSIQHHSNGSHTLTFHHHPTEEGKPGEDMSMAVPDDAGMHSAMQTAMAGPEPGAEGAAEGAGPAVPAAA